MRRSFSEHIYLALFLCQSLLVPLYSGTPFLPFWHRWIFAEHFNVDYGCASLSQQHVANIKFDSVCSKMWTQHFHFNTQFLFPFFLSLSISIFLHSYAYLWNELKMVVYGFRSSSWKTIIIVAVPLKLTQKMCRCDLASKHFTDFRCEIVSVCIYVCLRVYVCVCLANRIWGECASQLSNLRANGIAAMLSTKHLPM